MIKDFAPRKLATSVKAYTLRNWGAPFIAGFMLLLVAAAVSLSFELINLANELALVSYYALVVGFVLQLVCFFKNRKKRDVNRS